MPFKNMFMEKAYMLMSKKFKSLILMILTLTKYHENLLRDGTLSLLSMVKFFSSLEVKMILKIPNKTFLRITRYFYNHPDFQDRKKIYHGW